MYREISEENQRLKSKMKLNQEPGYGQGVQGTDIRTSSPSPMSKRSVSSRGEKIVNLGDFCEKKYSLAYID